MARGRVLHLVELPAVPAGRFTRAYPWSRDRPSTEPWRCSCRATGQGQEAAEEHLSAKAKAAFARMDHLEAFATAAVSDHSGPGDPRAALGLLSSTRHWFGHPGLRRRMHPYYDHFGCIAARLDFEAVAADLAAGELAGEDSDLLVLGVAVSLAGVAVSLRLSDLWRLPTDDMRHVRDALLNQLRLDGER